MKLINYGGAYIDVSRFFFWIWFHDDTFINGFARYTGFTTKKSPFFSVCGRIFNDYLKRPHFTVFNRNKYGECYVTIGQQIPLLILYGEQSNMNNYKDACPPAE